MVLPAHIRQQFRLTPGSQDRPRMTEALQKLGFFAGHRRIGRLMRRNSFSVKGNKKLKATADGNHSLNISPSLLARDFHPDAPCQKQAGDISGWGDGFIRPSSSTYIPVVSSVVAPLVTLLGTALAGPGAACLCTATSRPGPSRWQLRCGGHRRAAFITLISGRNTAHTTTRKPCARMGSRYR